MSDSFNPQELLSKLRAKSNNSTAASMSSTVASEQPPKRTHTTTAESEQKANSATKVQATKNIRAPISLTLTPSQRQENLNARLELEKEIKRLQDEVAFLVTENLQLKKDKEDVEQQFIEFKTKNEETVVKLRGKLAAVALNNSEILPADRGAGAGRLYGPASRPGEPISKYPTPHNYSASRSPTSAHKQARYMATPQSAQHGNQSGYHSGEGEGSGGRNLPPPPPAPPLGGFRDPTFSELMRRSTPDHVDFREALRRNGSTKLGTGLAPNPAAPQPHAHSYAPAHTGSSGGHGAGAGAGHSGAPHNSAHSAVHSGAHSGGAGSSGGYSGNNQFASTHPGSGNNSGPAPSSHVNVHSNSNSAQNYSNSNTPNASHPGTMHNQRTKSMSNVLLTSPYTDVQNESKGSGYEMSSHRQNSISNYAEMDQFLGNIGFTPANNGAFMHASSVGNISNKHTGNNQGPLEHGNAHSGSNAHAHSHHLPHAHSSHHNNSSGNSHSLDYLSAADTSDGDDIPVLEIDLSA